MKSVLDLCVPSAEALDFSRQKAGNVRTMQEVLSQPSEKEAEAYFERTYVTRGLAELSGAAFSRLAGKSNTPVIRLLQAMGGGKTHLMVALAYLAQYPSLRQKVLADPRVRSLIPNAGEASFGSARVLVFDGSTQTKDLFWIEIARQVGDQRLLSEFQSNQQKAPTPSEWRQLLGNRGSMLLLLDELPPYLEALSAIPTAEGSMATVAQTAFAALFRAVDSPECRQVCVVVADLEGAYHHGKQTLRQAFVAAVDNVQQELKRFCQDITPVDLTSEDLYGILRKRLFDKVPDAYDPDLTQALRELRESLERAAKAGYLDPTAVDIADKAPATYPFHPDLQHVLALFKENVAFRETRGVIELASYLVRSVWNRGDRSVVLIGGQHFDLSQAEVRSQLASISGMQEVLACDVYDDSGEAHAQQVDRQLQKGPCAQELATLLFVTSMAEAEDATKGLSKKDLLAAVHTPARSTSDDQDALDELRKACWYLHEKDGRLHFARQVNLRKAIDDLARNAPDNKVDDTLRQRVAELFQPVKKTAYEDVLVVPSFDEAVKAVEGASRRLLVPIDDGFDRAAVERLLEQAHNKNNILALAASRSQFADLREKARLLYAAERKLSELSERDPVRQEAQELVAQYRMDLVSTVWSTLDAVLYPMQLRDGEVELKEKQLRLGSAGQTAQGECEARILDALSSPPTKLYTDVDADFDKIRPLAEKCLWPQGSEEASLAAFRDAYLQNPTMPWLPPRGLDRLREAACAKGNWEDLGNGWISKRPKPKVPTVQVTKAGQDRDGRVRLKVRALHAGAHPRIHYQENGEVHENSPVLQGDTLDTEAVKVTFLAVNPDQPEVKGQPETWTNEFKIEIDVQGSGEARRAEIKATPKPQLLRCTTDGTEPRSGAEVSGPIPIGAGAVLLRVFASAYGVEKEEQFRVPPAAVDREIDPNRPLEFRPSAPRTFAGRKATYDAIQLLEERGASLRGPVIVTVGTGKPSIQVIFDCDEMPSAGQASADGFQPLRDVLDAATRLLGSSAEVSLEFAGARFKLGQDFLELAEKCGLEFQPGEVQQ